MRNITLQIQLSHIACSGCDHETFLPHIYGILSAISNNYDHINLHYQWKLQCLVVVITTDVHYIEKM